MGWERRRNKKYLYRSRRENGRVIREYVGKAEGAEAATERDAAARALREELKVIEAAVSTFCELVELLVTAEMLAAGFHRPKRGPWRKKRDAQ